MTDFTGAKAAIMYDGKLLTYLRDNKPNLQFANTWDFPGGGREDQETPFECLARETNEEFGITITEDLVIWKKVYPAMLKPDEQAYFFVVEITKELHDAIVFGDEGQYWKLMSVEEFMERDDVIPFLKGRLDDYLAEKGK